MKYKTKDSKTKLTKIEKHQFGKIINGVKKLMQRNVISKGLRTSKLQEFKPIGEDLYKASVNKSPSTYYLDVIDFPKDGIYQYGWIGGPSDTRDMIHTGREGIDFLTKRAKEGWTSQIREYNGLQYVSTPSGGYIVPIGYQLTIPSASKKYQYRPITSEQYARTIDYTPVKRNMVDEINNTWHLGQNNVRVLPGLQLQSTMRGAPIEKLIASDGTIHVNQLKKYFSTASKSDQGVVFPILEQLHDRVGYNDFRKKVQDSIGKFNIEYTNKYADYGMPRIGQDKVIKQVYDGNGGITEVPINPESTQAKTVLFTSDPQYYGVGSDKHFDEWPLGHIRKMITVEEPNVYHILESQSDKFQHFVPTVAKQQVRLQYPVGPTLLGPEEETGLTFNEATASYEPALIGKPSLKVKDIPDAAWGSIPSDIDLGDIPSTPQEIGLSKFWEERQLIEAMRDAVKGGQTKIRFPVDETAAKIEGYGQPMGPVMIDYSIKELPQLNSTGRLRKNEKSDYTTLNKEAKLDWENDQPVSQKYIDFLQKMEKKYPGYGRKAEFEDVLQHYRTFPKRLKTIGINDYHIITDPKGIQWYEFNIPESFLNGTAEYRAFNKGGIINRFKNKLKH